MSFFSGLGEEVKKLNRNVSDVANCEKAKALRKKLLSIGLPIAIIGWIGVFVCFILFATAGTKAFDNNGFTSRVLVPFILIIPFALIGGVGTSIASYGFKIMVTGYQTKFVDDVVGNNCPKCGDPIGSDEIFCSKCGLKLKNECPECHTINSGNDKFCKKCGKEL